MLFSISSIFYAPRAARNLPKMDENTQTPLAVTIISGFLGSGKTTLLRRVLAAAPRTAVIENELGAVPIDDAILSASAPVRLETVLGRTCCETRGMFVKLLRSFAESSADYDRLVIEATGVAHPGMMANSILADPILSEKLRVDGIVTVVDAANFEAHLDGDGHAREQVAYADSVIVNKRDLSTPAKIEKLIGVLKEINPAAKYTVASQADTDIASLMNLGGFDAKKIANSIDGCLSSCELIHHKPHDIVTVAVESTDAYAFLSLKEWMEDYIAKHRDDIYRAKGVVSLAKVDQQMVFQGVHDNFYIDLGAPWGDGERVSRLIFIGRNLNAPEIEAGLAKCKY